MYLCININIHVRLPKIKFQVHLRLPKIKFYNLHAEVVWKTVPRAIIPPIRISTLLQISMSEQNLYFSGVNCFFFGVAWKETTFTCLLRISQLLKISMGAATMNLCLPCCAVAKVSVHCLLFTATGKKQTRCRSFH